MRIRSFIHLALIALGGIGIALGAAPAEAAPCLGGVAEALAGGRTRQAFRAIPPAWRDFFGASFPDRVKGKTEVGPAVYHDFEAEMIRRVRAGDETGETLLRLGARLDESGERPRLLLPDAATLAENLNRRTDSLIAQGLLTEDDAIRPAVVFAHLTKHESYTLVRPGIDPWPDPQNWQPTEWVPQFSSLDWARHVSSGKMPFPIGDFALHDLAHWTELFRDPALMKATRRYYRKEAGRPPAWHDQIASVDYENYLDSPTRLHHARTTYQVEAFSLPNLAKTAEIQASFPDYFAPAAPASLAEAQARVQRIPTPELDARVRRVLASVDPLLLRQGGSQRDPYNSQASAKKKDYFKPVSAAIAEGRLEVRSPHEPSIGELHRDNLHGLAAEIQFLSRQKDRLAPPQQASAERLLRDRVARYEYGLCLATRLRLSPDQVVRDNLTDDFDPRSKTGAFIAGFAPPESMLWRVYLSPAATGADRPKPE